MALRDELRDRSEPYLEPGEHVEHVFMAQTGPNPWLFAIVRIFVFFVKPRIVVVTDRNVLVLRAGLWRPSFPKELLARLPRRTTFGSVRGLWGRIELNGERLWVHKRFHKDVIAADAAIAGVAN